MKSDPEDDALAFLNLAPLFVEELVDRTARDVDVRLRVPDAERPMQIHLQQRQELFVTGTHNSEQCGITEAGKMQKTQERGRHDFSLQEISIAAHEKNHSSTNDNQEHLLQLPSHVKQVRTEAERTTGGLVWDAGLVLAEYVFWNQHRLFPSKLAPNSFNCLELGAGCGLVGIALGKAGQRVLLTDLPVPADLLQNLRENVAKNEVMDNCAVMGLKWGSMCLVDEGNLSLDKLELDLIIAADCIYDEALVDPFLITVENLLRNYGIKKPASQATLQTRSRALIAFDTSLGRHAANKALYEALIARRETLVWKERVQKGKEVLAKWDGGEETGCEANFKVRKEEVVIIEICLATHE